MSTVDRRASVRQFQPRPKRRGFTMIETLAAFAVIAVLAAVLLPAVQNVRESARRSGCRHNLHQLALAALSYNDVHGMLCPSYLALHNDCRGCRYPVGGLADYYGACSGTPEEDANFHVWGEMLLPFINQGPVHDKIDPKAPIFSPIDMTVAGLPNYTANNREAAATPIQTFICPAAPHNQNPFEEKSEWLDGCCTSYRQLQAVFMAGASDYTTLAGYLGRLNNYYQAIVPPDSRNQYRHGTLFIGPSWTDSSDTNYVPRLANITDGLSTTIIFAERAGAPDLWRRGLRLTPDQMIHTTTGEYNFNSGGCWSCPDNGEYWIRGSTFDGASYPSTPGVPVCAINCTNEVEFGVYSFHPGRCNVVMVDGTVRSLNENIGVDVFLNLMTPRGHAKVPSDLF